MAELLTSSLLWRVLLAIGGWFSALAHSSKVLTFLGRTWRSSRTRAWCIRQLASADAPTRESRAAKRFERLNARLAARLTGWKIDVKSYSAAMQSGLLDAESTEDDGVAAAVAEEKVEKED